MTDPLPTPRTATDQWLAALVGEVRGLRRDLASPVEDVAGAGSGPVELTEPVRPTARTRVRPRKDAQ